jgi:DeoR family transcriptional regulator, fructose operon transcriptional repressor
MKAEERQKRIEAYLQKAEFASLEELAKHVGVSISTVRRDLDDLALGGAIRRTHGGARLLNPPTDEFAFSWRDTLQLAEKEAIGLACANLVQPGQSIIIDSGTTVYHAARHLEPQVMQVITNSLPVANLFASTQRIEVMVSGGVIYPRLGVLVGPLAVNAFSGLHADVAIMGGGGITLDGVMNSHALLIDIQKAMIHAAGKVIFCLDHTKFGRRSVAHLCDLSSIDIVVTDSAAPMDLVNALRDRGVEVVVASKLEGPSPEPVTLKRVEPPKEPTPTPQKPQTPARRKPASEPGNAESSDSRMGWD